MSFAHHLQCKPPSLPPSPDAPPTIYKGVESFEKPKMMRGNTAFH